MDTDIISLAEFGRRIGVGEKTIRDGIKLGKISKGVKVVNGKAKIVYSIAVIEAHQIGLGQKAFTAKGIESNVKKESPPGPEKEEEDPEHIAGLGPETSLITANRAERIFKAQLACLEVEQKAGTLVNKAEVYSQLFDFGKEMTTEFETMPSKIVHKIISCQNDENKISEIMGIEIRKSLNKLFEKIGDRKIG